MQDDFPQEGFESFPESAHQDDEQWGSFDNDWSSPSASEGSSGQDDFSAQNGSFIPQEDDGWGQTSQPDDFSAPAQNPMPEQQGSFIPQDDDGWGQTSGVVDTPPQQNDYASSVADMSEFKPKQLNLSMKKVALIILVFGIVVALIFLGLDKIHFTKKEPAPQPTQQQQQTQTQQSTQKPVNQGSNSDSRVSPTQDSSPVVDSVVLVEIPESTRLDYNGDVLEANGKVINKLKYVQSHQVLYCVNIGVAFGSSTETISYYCNYSSFSAVSEGDIVILKYQQVNDNYISVISISK